MTDTKALVARHAEDLKRLARGIRREHQGSDWYQAAKVADDAADALEAAQAEIERLREALQWIADAHIPDAPMVSNDDELTWAQRWVGTIRGRAYRALLGDTHE